jgi:cell division protein FtsL
MTLVLVGKLLMEIMFFVGIAGSAVVVTIATAEDARVLFSRKQHNHAAEKTPEA